MPVSSKKISEIAGYLRQSKDFANSTSFILGAGASIAAGIPSAVALVKEINDNFEHCLNSVPKERRANYGACMAALTPAERKSLIQPTLDNAKINWGQIAFASLLQHGYVARTLTFNFDLVLEKAVSLLGMQVPVYDFGVAPSRAETSIKSPSKA